MTRADRILSCRPLFALLSGFKKKSRPAKRIHFVFTFFLRSDKRAVVSSAELARKQQKRATIRLWPRVVLAPLFFDSALLLLCVQVGEQGRITPRFDFLYKMLFCVNAVVGCGLAQNATFCLKNKWGTPCPFQWFFRIILGRFFAFFSFYLYNGSISPAIFFLIFLFFGFGLRFLLIFY